MSFFQNLFYGGITILIGYELYDCYEKKGKLDTVAIVECFTSGIIETAGGVIKEIFNEVTTTVADNVGDPVIGGIGSAINTITGNKEHDDPIGKVEENTSSGGRLYQWWAVKDRYYGTKEALQEYNPTGNIYSVSSKDLKVLSIINDEDFHRLYAIGTDVDAPGGVHDFSKNPYYYTEKADNTKDMPGGEDEDEDDKKDSGKKKDGTTEKIMSGIKKVGHVFFPF